MDWDLKLRLKEPPPITGSRITPVVRNHVQYETFIRKGEAPIRVEETISIDRNFVIPENCEKDIDFQRVGTAEHESVEDN